MACWQVYVIGDVGIEEELDLLGIAHTGGPADNDKKVELAPGYAMPFDENVRPPVLLSLFSLSPFPNLFFSIPLLLPLLTLHSDNDHKVELASG